MGISTGKHEKLGNYVVCLTEVIVPETGEIVHIGRAADELAAYEDNNLTPEQFIELDKLYLAKCEEVNILNAELGRLKKLIPAFSVGDTAYIVDFEEGVIAESIVNGIVSRIDRQDTEFEYDSELLEFHSDDVGVIVFQSYKEAQEALERNTDV